MPTITTGEGLRTALRCLPGARSRERQAREGEGRSCLRNILRCLFSSGVGDSWRKATGEYQRVECIDWP